MAVLTFSPVSAHFGGIIYSGVSGQDVTVTNAVGVSAVITGFSVDNAQFTVTNVDAVSTVLDPSETCTFSVSSNWTDRFLNSNSYGTVTLNVSGIATGATSSVSYGVSALFDGISINNFTVPYTNTHFGTIAFSGVSAGIVTVTNNIGTSAVIRSVTVDNSYFVLNTAGTLNVLTNNGGTRTFVVSSNWADAYFDGTQVGTISVTVSAEGASSPIGTVTSTVSATFNGLEYIELNVDNDEAAYNFILGKGHKSMPQIYKDGAVFVQSVAELLRLSREGKLK